MRRRGLRSEGLFLDPLQVVGEIGEEVGLAEDQDVGGGEGLGIFLRLVVALGGREKNDADPFAQLVGGRADQVAHVSMNRKSMSASTEGRTRAIILASRWQAPPVVICQAGTPLARMRSASRSVSMSPSMTAIR